MEIGAIQPTNGISSNPVSDGEITKDVFLRLLSTQLQHQDPLEPASDVEFIQQMATFAQLEQQQLTNSNLQVMGLYESSINNSNALNLVGKEVKIQDGSMDHTEGASHTFTYAGADEAARVFITVKDSSGKAVYEQTLVGSEDGDQEFTWYGTDTDGEPVDPGKYNVEIKLEDNKGKLYNEPVFQNKLVKGISYENGSIMVLVGDKRISIENVVEVYGSNQTTQTSGTEESDPINGGFKNGFGMSDYSPGKIIPFPTQNPYLPNNWANAGGR